MSQQNNNRPQNPQSIIPSAEKLKEEALGTPLAQMSLVGSVWKTTLNDLATRFTNVIADDFEIDEIADIMFIPDYDPQHRNLTERTKCFAIFNVNGVDPKTANIYLSGSRRNGGPRMAVEVSGHSGRNGRFSTSDKFREKMSKIVAEDAIEYGENDTVSLRVQEAPNGQNNAAILELDINRVLQSALDVSSDYINFAVIQADPVGDKDFSLTIMKYIDNSNFSRKKKGRKGLNVASIKTSIESQFGRRNNGGNRGNGRNGRRF